MALFCRLLLAHLIADYPLQTAELVKWKFRSVWGSLAHAAVFGVVASLFVLQQFPKLWFWVLALTLVHAATDWSKIALSSRGPRYDSVWAFLLDQLIHVGVCAAVGAAAAGVELTHPLPGILARQQTFLLDVPYIAYPICYLSSACMGTYFLMFMAKTYPRGGVPLRTGLVAEVLGIAERALITTFVALGPVVAVLPVMAIKGVTIARLPAGPNGSRPSLGYEVFGSAAYAALFGGLLRLVT